MQKISQHSSFTAKKLYDGAILKSILMDQAYRDVNYCCDINSITHIHGIEAFQLIARIRRYADKRNLKTPIEINDEGFPFYAIKSKVLPNGETYESFKARKGEKREFLQLRAYFWDIEEEGLMCITHFIQKTSAYLQDKDICTCRNQKYFFEINNYQYS